LGKNTIHRWYYGSFFAKKKSGCQVTHSNAADLQRVSVFQTIPMLHCRHSYLGKTLPNQTRGTAVEGFNMFNPSSLGEGVGEGVYPSL